MAYLQDSKANGTGRGERVTWGKTQTNVQNRGEDSQELHTQMGRGSGSATPWVITSTIILENATSSEMSEEDGLLLSQQTSI